MPWDKFSAVVCTRSLTCVDVTDVGVSVTVAGYAPGGGPGVGRVPVESRGTALTELPDVAVRTVALLHVVRRLRPVISLPSRAQLNIVQESISYKYNLINVSFKLFSYITKSRLIFL